MKRTREGTISYYKNDFLDGKTEDFIKQFESKDVNKQYAAIMNWKRSLKKQESAETPNKYSISNLYRLLKEANKEVENLESLTPKEADKALELISIIQTNIKNFDRIKKQRLLADLMRQEAQIQKEGNSLRKRIADIQKELE